MRRLHDSPLSPLDLHHLTVAVYHYTSSTTSIANTVASCGSIYDALDVPLYDNGRYALDV
ncbi:hypothetical protein KY289_035327 [Solanum tuberosum]|nr:hypothetical protein KY289_035327 [Solanum tuberosum]